MLRKILAGVALIFASTTGFTQTSMTVDPVAQVQALAPQLVAFAGSDANFRSLVAGLSQGIAITLTTFTSDGFLQTVTFTPANAESSTAIAQTLEAARQQLIARGIGTPTAQQIGTMLAGGALPTPLGTVQVPATIATITPGGLAAPANAAAGASTPRFATTTPTSNLNVSIQPAVAPVAGTGTPNAPATSTGTSPTTTTPLPIGTGPIPVMSAPNPVFSGSNPVFTTTPAPSTTNPNGAPSAAVQMQGRH